MVNISNQISPVLVTGLFFKAEPREIIRHHLKKHPTQTTEIRLIVLEWSNVIGDIVDARPF